MAKTSRPTAQKRAKERARQEKQQQKEARRLESKERKASSGMKGGEEDADIAGIRPGPQPLPAEWGTMREIDEEKS
jgi:hypothetical protein